MTLCLETLKRQIIGNHGQIPEIRCWYRLMHRELQELGFKALGRGKFVNGKFRVTISIVRCNAEYASGFVYISGPEDVPKKLNLYQLADVKFVILNRFGKLCKVPAGIWDRKRRSISVARM